MSDIKTDDHSLAFTDDTKLGRIKSLISTTSLQVELEGDIAKVLVLTLHLRELGANNANGVYASLGIRDGLDAIVDSHIVEGQNAKNKIWPGTALCIIHMTEDGPDSAIVGIFLAVDKINNWRGWGWNEVTGVDAGGIQEGLESHDSSTKITFLESIRASVGAEPDVSPWTKVTTSLKLDISHIPRAVSRYHSGIFGLVILVFDQGWREDACGNGDEARTDLHSEFTLNDISHRRREVSSKKTH